jgi:hypothetical protein
MEFNTASMSAYLHSSNILKDFCGNCGNKVTSETQQVCFSKGILQVVLHRLETEGNHKYHVEKVSLGCTES